MNAAHRARIWTVALALALSSRLVAAQVAVPDTVFLKNGGRLRGTVVREDPREGVTVVVGSNGNQEHVKAEDVDHVEYGSASAVGTQPLPAAPQPAGTPANPASAPAPAEPNAAPPPATESATRDTGQSPVSSPAKEGWRWDAGGGAGAVSQKVMKHWGGGLWGIAGATRQFDWWGLRLEGELLTYLVPANEGEMGITTVTARPMFAVRFGPAEARLGPAIGVAFERFGRSESCAAQSEVGVAFGGALGGSWKLGPGALTLVIELLKTPTHSCSSSSYFNGHQQISFRKRSDVAMLTGLGYVLPL